MPDMQSGNMLIVQRMDEWRKEKRADRTFTKLFQQNSLKFTVLDFS